MPCRLCQSRHLGRFSAELNIHLSAGLKDLDKPSVLIYPQLVVCLDCGFTEFLIGKAEVPRLRESDYAAA